MVIIKRKWNPKWDWNLEIEAGSEKKRTQFEVFFPVKFLSLLHFILFRLHCFPPFRFSLSSCFPVFVFRLYCLPSFPFLLDLRLKEKRNGSETEKMVRERVGFEIWRLGFENWNPRFESEEEQRKKNRWVCRIQNLKP